MILRFPATRIRPSPSPAAAAAAQALRFRWPNPEAAHYVTGGTKKNVSFDPRVKRPQSDFDVGPSGLYSTKRGSTKKKVLMILTSSLMSKSRLANQAELAGGRKVYSHTLAPRIPLR